MKFLTKLRVEAAIQRLGEEALYEQVAQELAAGARREGIWAQSIADSDGDLSKARALYIQYRVKALKDEALLSETTASLGAPPPQLTQEELARQREANAVAFLEENGYRVTKSWLGRWRVSAPYGGMPASVADTLDELEGLAQVVRDGP